MARGKTRSQLFILLPLVAFGRSDHSRAGFGTVGLTDAQVEMRAICPRAGHESHELSLSLKNEIHICVKMRSF